MIAGAAAEAIDDRRADGVAVEVTIRGLLVDNRDAAGVGGLGEVRPSTSGKPMKSK